MSKPSFSIVALTLVVLAALGAVVQSFKALLPPPQPNAMEAEVGTYMRQASQQAIRWHPLSKGALDIANTQDKPILLVVGAAWSRNGRAADLGLFADPEVATIVEKNFVPIRVDCNESPEWLNAYFPLNRPDEL